MTPLELAGDAARPATVPADAPSPLVAEVHRFLADLRNEFPRLFAQPKPPPADTFPEVGRDARLPGSTAPPSAAPPQTPARTRGAASDAALPTRDEARSVLARRTEFWSRAIGVRYGRVSIRDQKSLWGSCSRRGDLSYNWRLVLAPPQVLDYVVIHELCHLLEMNHSKRFWRHVARWCPDQRSHRRWLRDNDAALKANHAVLDPR